MTKIEAALSPDHLRATGGFVVAFGILLGMTIVRLF
jgi:uncharacterized protein YjeT (DUF2065 family)